MLAISLSSYSRIYLMGVICSWLMYYLHMKVNILSTSAYENKPGMSSHTLTALYPYMLVYRMANCRYNLVSLILSFSMLVIWIKQLHSELMSSQSSSSFLHQQCASLVIDVLVWLI
jgi:hypothetical protein